MGSGTACVSAIQSSVQGNLAAKVKGVSQMASGYAIFQRDIALDTDRRDMELYFQSDLGEQSVVMFSQYDQRATYWLDNVELHRVTVQPLTATNEHLLLANETFHVRRASAYLHRMLGGYEREPAFGPTDRGGLCFEDHLQSSRNGLQCTPAPQRWERRSSSVVH
jgi:hypothetical protein